MSGSTIAIIIIIVALLVILFTSYVKSPPDKAYIISGLRKTPKILIPFFFVFWFVFPAARGRMNC